MFGRPLLAIGLLLCGLSVLEIAFGVADAIIGGDNWQAFMIGAAITGVSGAGAAGAFWSAGNNERTADYRSAFILTALSWTVLPLMASLPFYFSEENISLTDAVFETVSGITTTGSTVIAGLDDLDPMLLLWRSMLQWFGGVGIIVMAIIMMPFLRIGGMQLFQLESSARTDSGVIARPMALIRSIATLYAALTLFCAAAYLAAGMSLFDAVNHAMTTLATGGYSTHDASLGYFDSKAVLWTSVAFMIAGALPFVAYMRMVNGRPGAIAEDPQAPLFLILLIGTWFIAAGFLNSGEPYLDTLLRVAVNITSVVTTTGYASEDYQLWGPGFVGLFFALTFVGGCAGSTSGGIKIYRFQLLRIFAAQHLRRLYSPSIVAIKRYGGVKLSQEIAFSVLSFLALFIGAFSLGALALAVTGLDLITAISSAATALCNVGPGFGDIVGPAGNFAAIPDASKWILIVLMLLGRLELFALLVFLDPYFWR